MRSLLIRGLTVLLAGVAIAFSMTLGSQFISAIRTTSATPVRVDAALGNWQYQYSYPAPGEDGDYMVLVKYPMDSVADVQTAANALNESAKKLASESQPFQATLVFARPLSVAEFTQFIESAGLAPTGSIVRSIQSDGMRVTTGVPPVWATDANGRVLIGQPAPGQPPFDQGAFDRMNSKHLDDRMLGIVSTDVTLDAAAFEKVKGNPLVYAVDVLQHVITQQIQQQHHGVSANKIQVRPSQLYWTMENAGIVVSE